MTENCPFCEGRLIEKHEEVVEERGKRIKVLHLRCVRCGKWTKKTADED
ncbi:MAG: hypothetical protein RTU30_11660 [Candidatus Thorarchaeota archaeon]